MTINHASVNFSLFCYSGVSTHFHYRLRHFCPVTSARVYECSSFGHSLFHTVFQKHIFGTICALLFVFPKIAHSLECIVAGKCPHGISIRTGEHHSTTQSRKFFGSKRQQRFLISIYIAIFQQYDRLSGKLIRSGTLFISIEFYMPFAVKPCGIVKHTELCLQHQHMFYSLFQCGFTDKTFVQCLRNMGISVASRKIHFITGIHRRSTQHQR